MTIQRDFGFPRPTSLREAVAFLTRSPRVRLTGPTPGSNGEVVSRVSGFSCFDRGRMWFSDGGFIPLSCSLTTAAAESETGVDFDDAGFTVTKFGVTIRVEYLTSERSRLDWYGVDVSDLPGLWDEGDWLPIDDAPEREEVETAIDAGSRGLIGRRSLVREGDRWLLPDGTPSASVPTHWRAIREGGVS